MWVEVITMMYPGYMPDYMGWMMLGQVAFWAILATLAVFALVRFARPNGRRSSAKTILEERLARGEIDAEEYRARLALLSA